MYSIKFDMGEKDYVFSMENQVLMKGDLPQITQFALEEGFSQDELVLAYDIMRKEKHTTAEFGINKCFLFSK